MQGDERFSGDLSVTGLSVSLQPGARAASTAGPDVQDFSVSVSDGEQQVRFWERYALMPERVRLPIGDYTLRAAYGDAQALAFEAPAFEGTQSLRISPQAHTQVSVVCSLANAQVSVQYTDRFKALYTDYGVDLEQGDKLLSLIGEETRRAYAAAADLRTRIYYVNAKGEQLSYRPAPIALQARDHLHLRLDAKEQNGEVLLSIATDTTTQDKDIVVELPAFLLPKQQPVLTAAGADNGQWDAIEGVARAARVDIRAPGQLRSCQLRIADEGLLAQGFPAEVDLLSADESVLQQLRDKGLRWFEKMEGATLSYIDFGGMATHLTAAPGQTTTYPFSLQVEDAFGQTSGWQPYVLAVAAPSFSLQTPEVGDVWATHARLQVELLQGDAARLSFGRFDGQVWQPLEYKLQQRQDGQYTFLVKGLQPGAEQQLRVSYGAHGAPAVAVHTEEVLQLPNAGFEQWHDQKVYEKKTLWVGRAIYEHFPYVQGEQPYWNSRNPLTTSQRSGTSCFYTSYSGAVATADARSGLAAEVSTLGWGEGNTFLNSMDGVTIKNRTAGMLFLGDYRFAVADAHFQSEEIIPGRAFASRPLGLSFFYKYAPMPGESFCVHAVVLHRQGDTEVELASAELEDGQGQGSYKEQMLRFAYDPAHVHLKATHLYIAFTSSTAPEPQVQPVKGGQGVLNGYTDSRYVGSVLKIDELSLQYDPTF